MNRAFMGLSPRNSLDMIFGIIEIGLARVGGIADQ